MNKHTKPKAHVIIGFIGAGKTTFAKKLERETGAIRFTKDEWMVLIFGKDPTFEGFEQLDTRVAELAVRIALKCLRSGTDVIIDEGFWVRSQREEICKKIEQAGGTVKMYYLKKYSRNNEA